MIRGWAATDTGRKRDHNEDSFVVDGDLGLFAVADGMGGHQGGECASRMALDVVRRDLRVADGDFDARAAELANATDVDDDTAEEVPHGGTTDELGFEDTLDGDSPEAREVQEALAARAQAMAEGTGEHMPADPVEQVLLAAARNACREIYDRAQSEPELHGMGTTLTALLYFDGQMHYAHAGDSRAYLFRDGRLEQLTEDHSWIWEQIKSGAMTEEEARESKFRHIITRSVGFEREVEVDCGGLPVQAGDCFLLCSDGMSNYLENDELQEILRNNWLRRVPRLLIDLANDRGGDDNITVVVVHASNDADDDAADADEAGGAD